MKFIHIISSILIFSLSIGSLSARIFEEPNAKIRVYESKSYSEEKIETRKFTNKKLNIVYNIDFGSDLSGNMTSIDLKILTENLTAAQKADFIKKFRAMIEKFTSFTNDGKKNLIFPQENCVMKCVAQWHCSDKPTNMGVTLCTSDCVEECYF